MRSLENFVLLCGIQTILLSILLLIAVLIMRTIFRRHTTALVLFGLASMAGLWLLALVPMNGWMPSYLDRTSSINRAHWEQPRATEPEDPADISDSDSSTNNSQIAPNEPLISQWFRASVEELQRNDLDVQSSVSAPIVSWKKWIAILIVMAISFGLIRLGIAYFLIWRLQSTSSVVTDCKLIEQLDVIRARLNCRRSVSVSETGATSAAFTLGWLKPQIVLSDAWRNWSADELEATLAHEVAHVHSSDFLQRVIAQIAAALNFYNPIVHYLCSLLCIDQEFRADQCASSIVGGRKSYLNTLATLALQNDELNQRLAPMFLPTRKTFFRRIEMLRSKETVRTESQLGRWAGIVFAIALMVVTTGVRFEKVQAAVSDLTESDSTESQSTKANLRFVPNDANLVMVIRLGEILKNDSMKKLNQALVPAGTDTSQLDKYCQDVFGVKLDNIDQLTMHYTTNNEFSAMGLVVQLSQDGWWAGSDSNDGFKEKLVATRYSSFRGKPIYRCEKVAWRAMYCTPDDRTMVVAAPANNEFATELILKSSIRSSSGPRASGLIEKWSKIAASPLSLIVRDKFLDLATAAMDARKAVWSPLVKPLLENAQQIVAAMDLDENKLDIGAWIYADANRNDDRSVKQISDSTSVLVNLGKTMLRSTSGENGGADSQAISDIMNLGVELLENVRVNNEKDCISLSTSVAAPGDDLLLPLIPAITAINQASARVEAANEMRNLMLALLNYEAANGSFPPAVLTSKNGKKFSWRVAILPFLGRSDLFEKYRFDEDWDSDHNLKLAREIPNEFQHPINEALGSDFCSYFLVTGKGTGFDGDVGMRIIDLMDGTSNTLCIVEAKKDAFWTQPVDVVFDDDKLDTTLGGYTPGGFNGSLFDGSTQFMSSQIDPATLRLLFLKSDGQTFDWNDVWAGR